jgi:hypothetical protein
MQSSEASSSAAASGSTRLAWPMSISQPTGAGMIAPPSGRPEETKPNTLPICPGGMASFSITSRGVRDDPSATPATKATASSSQSGIATVPIASSSAALTAVSPTTKPNSRLERSAYHPPTSVPPVAPIM